MMAYILKFHFTKEDVTIENKCPHFDKTVQLFNF